MFTSLSKLSTIHAYLNIQTVVSSVYVYLTIQSVNVYLYVNFILL